MDYIELARQLSGNTSSAIARKTATATSASANGTVQIDIGGNNITVPTIGNIGEGDTVEYIVQDGMPVAVGTKGAGDALRDNVEGLQTLIRSTDDGVEVAKVDEGGGYVGTHTEMTADAFEVHDKNHNKLASFGANEVNLANTNQSAIINMCGGTGNIRAIRGEAVDDAYIVMTGNAGAQLVAGSQSTSFLSRVMAVANNTSGAHANLYSEFTPASGAKQVARVDVVGGTPSAPSQVSIAAHTIFVNGNTLADYVIKSYTSDNWYVERYASGLVKQYWYGLASFATSVGWVAQQAYPVALSAVYSAQVTGGDYRVTQLYTAPMEQSGAACYIGGMASAAHQSNVSLCVIGMAAS